MRVDYTNGESAPELVALCSNCTKEDCSGFCDDYAILYRRLNNLPEFKRRKDHVPKRNVEHNRRSYMTLMKDKAKPQMAFGEAHKLPEWAEIYGLKYVTLYARLRSGYTLEEALVMPIDRGKLIVEGRSMSIDEWGREYGINPSTIRGRLKRGWTPEMAVKQPPLKNWGDWSKKPGARYGHSDSERV